VVCSALSALHHCRAERFLVASPTSRDLLICAKDLFVAASGIHRASHQIGKSEHDGVARSRFDAGAQIRWMRRVATSLRLGRPTPPVLGSCLLRLALCRSQQTLSPPNAVFFTTTICSTRVWTSERLRSFASSSYVSSTSASCKSSVIVIVIVMN
jgi:hypothetical protein